MMMIFGFVPLLLIFIAVSAFRVFRRNTLDVTPRGELTEVAGSRRLDGVVFGLAKRLRGRVTLSDVVVEVEEQGRLVYEFPELLDESGGSR